MKIENQVHPYSTRSTLKYSKYLIRFMDCSSVFHKVSYYMCYISHTAVHVDDFYPKHLTGPADLLRSFGNLVGATD